MLQEQTVVGDCYILQARIGEDSCSEFWMATAIFSAKRFLLRFLKPERVKPEQIESLRKRALESYHIRGETIKDFVEIDDFAGRLFISSEYYDERALSDFFSLGYAMSLVHVCRAIRMVAQGLQCFHDVGVLYGNLSPENIVVEIRGREISSYKIVKPPLLCESDSVAAAYSSPECKAGKAPSRGSDIYSLGILVVFLITGIFPFEGGDASRINPSLRYVTNALFRRGIPEKMVRIVLGMLMPSPAARYGFCSALLNDLHQFMIFPEYSAAGNNAPGENGNPSAASPAFRSFDSTDYFNKLSSGEKRLEHARDRVYPVKQIDGFSDTEKIEREEMRILPDEASWSIDDYIASGRRTVAGIHEGLSTEETESDGIKNEVSGLSVAPAGRTANQSVELSSVDAAPTGAVPLPYSRQSASAETAIPVLVDTNATGVGQLTVKNDVFTNKRTWTHHRIRVKDVYSIIHRSAQLAAKGRGSFRYIQEPESGYAGASFFESLENLSGESLYVNLGSCARYGMAGPDDFLAMLRKSLAAALARESRSSVARLAKRISHFDVNGYFRLPPLGKNLYGNAVALPAIAVSPDPASFLVLADCVCAFARKKKPLVLVMRGGERIGRELQDFFTVLTGAVSTQPVCVVVFFDRIAFEPWQTLSLLSAPQRFDNAG